MKNIRAKFAMTVVSAFFAFESTASPLIDPQSREYMKSVERIAECAAVAAVATGNMNPIRFFDVSSDFELELYNGVIGEGRWYELYFELGTDYFHKLSPKELTYLGVASDTSKDIVKKLLVDVQIFILVRAKIIKNAEENFNVPIEHKRLIERRTTEKLASTIGFYSTAPIKWLGKEVRDCHLETIDAFAKYCKSPDLPDSVFSNEREKFCETMEKYPGLFP